MSKVVVLMPAQVINGLDIWDDKHEVLGEIAAGDSSYSISETEDREILRVELLCDRKSNNILRELEIFFPECFEVESVTEDEYFETKVIIPPGVVNDIGEMCQIVNEELNPELFSVILSSMGLRNPDSIEVNLVAKSSDQLRLHEAIKSLGFGEYVVVNRGED